MRRCAAILALLALVSCKEKPKPPAITPVARGAAVFAPSAQLLGELLASQLNETAYKEYLEQTKSTDKAGLGRAIAAEILKNYAAAMAVTEPQDAAYKAGTFDDAGTMKRVKAAMARFADTKANIPPLCQVAMMKVESGSWGTGLQLEFVARLLEGNPGAARH